MGAPCFRAGFCSKTIIPDSEEHPLASSRAVPKDVLRWIRAKARIDDTLDMHYEDDNFTDPWKTPETVVLQHCNAGSSRMYYRWAPVVARHYRFIRVDRRGQGQSTVPAPGYSWSLPGFAQDMHTFLDRLGLQQVHLIGEATGSKVSLQYAYDHPERLKSLTLINFDPKTGDQSRMWEYQKMLEEVGVEGWVRKTMVDRFDPSQVDPECIEWHAQEKIRQPQHVSAELLKYSPTVDVTNLLPGIKVPTMLIDAEESVMHPREKTQRLAGLIPDSKVVTINGVSGYVAHAAPERCAEAWLDFVRGLD